MPFSIPSTEPGNPYTEANFSTALINDRTGRFYETTVKSDAGNTTIVITDQLGNDAKVINTGVEGKDYNVMARDIIYTVNNSAQKIPNSIYSSSFSVIQPIDRALLNDGLYGYDGRFRRFVSTGEVVDTMSVGGSSYLVANSGNVKIKSAISGTEKTMRAAYILAAIDESNDMWDPNYTREDFVLKGDKTLLITNEGFLIERDSRGDVKYITETGEDGNAYMVKLDKNGEVIDRVLYVED